MCAPGWTTIVPARAFHGKAQVSPAMAGAHQGTTHVPAETCSEAEDSAAPTPSPHAANSSAQSWSDKANKKEINENPLIEIFQESCLTFSLIPSMNALHKNLTLLKTD